MVVAASTTVTGGPKAMAKELRHAKKAELGRVGQLWHDKMAPKHFSQQATARYGYQKRKKGYTIRKAKRKGHTRPLEYTGDMKRQVLRAARITSTSRGARVVMKGPRYLYAYRKDQSQPHKAEEITATTRAERDVLAALYDRRMTRRLNRLDGTETV